MPPSIGRLVRIKWKETTTVDYIDTYPYSQRPKESENVFIKKKIRTLGERGWFVEIRWFGYSRIYQVRVTPAPPLVNAFRDKDKNLSKALDKCLAYAKEQRPK